jgi:hypothetical protein
MKEFQIKIGNETIIKSVEGIEQLKDFITDITFDKKIKNYTVHLENGDRASPRAIAEKWDEIDVLVVKNRDQARQ